MKTKRPVVLSSIFLPALFLALTLQTLQAQTTWFEDAFNRFDPGKSWNAATGEWKVKNGTVGISTKEYDQLFASSYYAYNLQPYSIEVTLRGLRAGLYFSLDDTDSKALSQMVRFDENSILTGYFNAAGEFTATSTFTLAKAPTDWTVLRVDIDPKLKRYEVFVDNRSVGSDDHLVYPSGHPGLEASDGTCEFKSFRIFGAARPKVPSRPRLGSKIRFQHVSVVQSEDKNVRIYNPELRLWQTMNPDGKVIAQMPSNQKPPMATKVTYRSLTYEIRNRKVYILNEAGIVTDSLSERLMAPSSMFLDSRPATPVLDIADPGAGAILQFGLDGKLKTVIDGGTMGGFMAPRSMAPYGERSLVIADYDKLVFYNPEVDSRPVTATPLSPTEMHIEWYSMTRLHTFIEYTPDGGTTKTLNRVSVHPHGQRTAILRNLQPLTRYSFRVSPTMITMPEEFAHSRTYRFATPPADTTAMAITRLPVLYMVYRTVCYRDVYSKVSHPQLPDGRTLSNEEIEYLRTATEFNRNFYFRNSSCKLVLDFDFSVVEDTLWLHEIGTSDPYWLSPNERVTRDYEAAVRHFGKSLTYYAGLVCPYAWVNYPPRRTSAMRDPSVRDSINIRQAVGGGTYGVPAPWKYGTTTGFTSMPFQDKFSRQDWLLTHEFHHQVDALQSASGYSGYYHADIPWQMPGRFGEDFDFNAHILRNAPIDTWLTLKFGVLQQATDADHDGVPDNDPSLPFDERRLKGNPRTKDTDADGLDDLQEVMTGTSRGTDLNNKDSDGDGLSDGVDPEPLYPTNPVVAKMADLSDLERVPFASVNASDLHGSTYLRWDDHFLYFRANTDKPANLLIQIDAANDGWFHGFDNVQARVMNNGDSVWVADYYLRDCSSWKDSPKDRRDILSRADLQVVSVTRADDSPGGRVTHSVTVKIPRDDKYGLNLETGKKMSVRFGLQTVTDLWVWDELFERNYTMQITLQ